MCVVMMPDIVLLTVLAWAWCWLGQKQHVKDMREKKAIASRVGGFTRFDPPRNPLKPVEGSLSYGGYADSFTTDAVKEEKQKQRERTARLEACLNSRRAKNLDREKQRLEKMVAEEERQQKHNEDLKKSKLAERNMTSAPCNPITMKYENDGDGDWLKFKDELTRYRAAVRAENLYRRARAVSYNVITGVETPIPVDVPPRPTAPGQLPRRQSLQHLPLQSTRNNCNCPHLQRPPPAPQALPPPPAAPALDGKKDLPPSTKVEKNSAESIKPPPPPLTVPGQECGPQLLT
ncbi:hypothetical protein CBR_g2774 [Chara braunii]|uniref:Uncharacterized protein n=1 Tax=Chara braunii TaxID=69332 RepID=A0A388KE51_CHABU|nr:hypothetical protein CBR_g2774 [Chara braunii]|eukprot:GBG68223.1 hypothetical protein CBR_g2774 [Chara braunii]